MNPQSTHATVQGGRDRAAPITAVAAGLAASISLALAIRSAVIAWQLSTPVPYEDQWEFIGDLIRLHNGEYGLSDLFSLQNEHRIFTSRLSFFIDYYFFRLGNTSVVVTNYAVLALLSAVLSRIATRGRPVWVLASTFAVVLASLWSLSCWINLGWGFQLQWAHVHCWPVVALSAFAAAARRQGRGAGVLLAAVCFADALGIFSMASGLCAIVPLAAVAFWLRARPAMIAIVGTVHAVLVAIYLWGYEGSGHALVFDPVRLATYVLPYLGTALPVSPTGSTVLGGLGFILASVALLVVTLRATRGQACEGALAILLGVVCFVLAESVVTAVGRAGSGDPLASALRYGTPSVVFWTALTLAGWRWLALRGDLRTARCLALFAVCGVGAENLIGSTHMAWAQWSAAVDNEGFNLINGVTTGPSALATYPEPDLIQDRFAFLRDQRLGPFWPGQSRFAIPHERLDGLIPRNMPVCSGVTDIVERDGGPVHVRGWAVTKGMPLAMIGVAAIDRTGRLRAYASAWEPRWDERQMSGLNVVKGYDFWFQDSSEPLAPAIDLVALFPPGTAPACRVPIDTTTLTGTQTPR